MGVVDGKKTRIIQRKCIRRQKGNSEPMIETIETNMRMFPKRVYLSSENCVCACVCVLNTVGVASGGLSPNMATICMTINET